MTTINSFSTRKINTIPKTNKVIQQHKKELRTSCIKPKGGVIEDKFIKSSKNGTSAINPFKRKKAKIEAQQLGLIQKIVENNKKIAEKRKCIDKQLQELQTQELWGGKLLDYKLPDYLTKIDEKLNKKNMKEPKQHKLKELLNEMSKEPVHLQGIDDKLKEINEIFSEKNASEILSDNTISSPATPSTVVESEEESLKEKKPPKNYGAPKVTTRSKQQSK